MQHKKALAAPCLQREAAAVGRVPCGAELPHRAVAQPEQGHGIVVDFGMQDAAVRHGPAIQRAPAVPDNIGDVPEHRNDGVERMAAEIAQHGRTLAGVREPGVAGHVHARFREKLQVERAAHAAELAEIAFADHLSHQPRGGRRLNEGVDRADQILLLPQRFHPARFFGVHAERHPGIDVLAAVQRRADHRQAQGRAGSCVHDVDARIVRHRHVIGESQFDAEFFRCVLRGFRARGADGDDFHIIEAAPRGQMRDRPPGRADDADPQLFRHSQESFPFPTSRRLSDDTGRQGKGRRSLLFRGRLPDRPDRNRTGVPFPACKGAGRRGGIRR
ncbi:MAG: hypothetical protein M0R03_04240 [Novosphingobium sp.]|nr:hypothetical protein [Novosphingobium sp.]